MKKLTIEQNVWGWDVRLEDGDAVFPTTSYTNKDAALARAMQLLDIDHAVEPQRTPEEIGLD